MGEETDLKVTKAEPAGLATNGTWVVKIKKGPRMSAIPRVGVVMTLMDIESMIWERISISC